MSIDLQLLHCYVAVYEERHFGRAGERLGYSTSHVSQRIRQLERLLGVDLFVRTSRDVQASVAGEQLVAKARAVLSGVDDFAATAHRLAERGDHLVVGYSAYSRDVAVRLMRTLEISLPDRRVALLSVPDVPDLKAALRDDQVFLGVTRSRMSEFAQQKVRSLRPFSLQHHFEHRFANRDEITTADLDGEDVLIASRDDEPCIHDGIIQFFESRSIRPRWHDVTIRSFEEVSDFVASRRGLAITYAFEPPPPNTRFIPLLGEVPPAFHDVYVVWPRGRRTRETAGAMRAIDILVQG